LVDCLKALCLFVEKVVDYHRNYTTILQSLTKVMPDEKFVFQFTTIQAVLI